MNKLIYFFSLVFLVIAPFKQSIAQGSENDSADSLQRIIMKDSLHVDDSVISRVFNVRNNFLARSSQINGDTTLREDQRAAALQSLITETNLGIRDALGAEAFEYYKQMIRRKLASKGINRTGALASQTGN